MFKCSSCGSDWPENYCPVCARTIDKPLPQQKPPVVPRPAAISVMKLPAQYPYNPNWRGALGFLVASGGFCGTMIYTAMHNRAGLKINHGLITLGPGGATRFYWGNAGVFGLFTLLSLLAVWRGIFRRQVLVLETDAILLPTGFLQTHKTRILYADIQGYSEMKYPNQTTLKLAVNGRNYGLHATLFPHPANYIAVRNFVLSKIRA
jgi:hypothetical protein